VADAAVDDDVDFFVTLPVNGDDAGDGDGDDDGTSHGGVAAAVASTGGSADTDLHSTDYIDDVDATAAAAASGASGGGTLSLAPAVGDDDVDNVIVVDVADPAVFSRCRVCQVNSWYFTFFLFVGVLFDSCRQQCHCRRRR
jgi:hypothetical protein